MRGLLRVMLVGSWPCRLLLRTRPKVVRLRTAGVARVCVASGWALRSGTCRPGCALVGAASYTNGLGMALLIPSKFRSSRERRGRCLMDMDRYAILLIFNLRCIRPPQRLRRIFPPGVVLACSHANAHCLLTLTRCLLVFLAGSDKCSPCNALTNCIDRSSCYSACCSLCY